MHQPKVEVEPARKPLVAASVLSRFSAHHFAPAPSGVDSNLLILLHGLGDSDTPFFTLGQSLQKTLPQTAVLTLQAPHGVPFLDPGRHWMWYPTFDQFGEILTKPNPRPTVDHLKSLLEHLTGACGWSASHIHFFGFGQGATIALETLVDWTKSHADEPLARPGSVVSVSGEFISHPTLTEASGTPVLHIYRSPSEVSRDASRWASFRKATSALQLHRLALAPGGADEAMLRGQEWDGVMQFWSKLLRSRSSWELSGDVVPLAPQK